MTDVTAEDTGKIDIGRVLAGTFQVLGRNIVTFGILALLLVGLPAVLTGLIVPRPSPANPFAMLSPMFFVSILVAVVASAILQGAIVYGTVRDLNGERPSVGDTLATGLRAFLPLIGLSILMAIGLVIGFALLIVPGFILLCIWTVAVPALVAERLGIFDAFGRSAELTRGNRWRIFALLIIVWVLSTCLSVAGGLAVGGATISAAMTGAAPALSPVAVIVNAFVSALAGVITATGVAVLYVELRKTKGVGSQWLAEIFS